METPKKKTALAKAQKPAHTVRRGAIAANIWLRQTQTGFDYFDFSLSWSWKSGTTGRKGYSTSFFPRNEPELLKVTSEASAWTTSQELTSQEAVQPSNSSVPTARIETAKVPASEARN